MARPVLLTIITLTVAFLMTVKVYPEDIQLGVRGFEMVARGNETTGNPPWAVYFQGPQGERLQGNMAPFALMNPNPGDTLLWDDGNRWTWVYYFEAGNGWGVEFQPYYYPCRVTSIIIWFNEGWPSPGGDDLIIAVADDDGTAGSPGTILYADTLWDVAQLGAWNEFDVGDTGVIIDDGTFYGVYIQAQDGPDCPSVGFDEGFEENHTWSYYNDEWDDKNSYGDMLLRAVTERAGGDAHDAGVKSILAPGRDYDPSQQMIPTALVKNFGTFEETFDVNCQIENEGALVYDETVNVSGLAPDQGEQVQFPAFGVEQGNVYDLTFTTLLSPDDTPFNDTRSIRTKNYTQDRSAVLIEGGTGTWCYWCQFSAQGLDSLWEMAGDSVAIVEYHQGDEFTTESSLSRINYYSIEAYPTVYFDGGDKVVGASETIFSSYRMKTNDEFQKKVPVHLYLGGNYNDQTRQGYALVQVRAVDGIAATDLRLFTVLTESHIAYAWHDEDSLQFVMREFFPDTSGIPISLGKGEFHQEIVNFEVSQDFVDTNCDLVVFLQDFAGKDVIGSRISPLQDLGPLSAGGDESGLRLPHNVELFQNYPNPFNPRTRIEYRIPKGPAREVELTLYNLRGMLIRTLVSGRKDPGSYAVMWDGKDATGREVGSGIYFYRLRVGDTVKTAKMLLTR